MKFKEDFDPAIKNIREEFSERTNSGEIRTHDQIMEFFKRIILSILIKQSDEKPIEREN